MTDHTPLTEQQLDEIKASKNAAAPGSWAIYEYGNDGSMTDVTDEVRRLRTRTLTPGEYNAAWHAVEGAVGEEGADPGTVLHAVLDRLGIAWQDAAAPAAVETGE